jgi:hypothetical protein
MEEDFLIKALKLALGILIITISALGAYIVMYAVDIVHSINCP